MASVDLKLDNVYVEDVKRFKILKGQKGELTLNRTEEDYAGPTDTATTGDPILEVKNLGEASIAEFTAKEVGVSRFFFIQKADNGFTIIKELRIEVVPQVVDLATDLGLTGEVIPS